MLTHIHFVVAMIAVLVAEFIISPERSAGDMLFLSIAAGFISALMDLDVVILVHIKSKHNEKLRQFRNPVKIYREFDSFLRISSELQLLRYTLASHILFSALILLLSYMFFEWFFMPSALGIVSHLITDIPEFYSVLGGKC